MTNSGKKGRVDMRRTQMTFQTLRVYALLVKADKPVGVREIQKKAGFRSPSTAKHHLDRLVDLGLAERLPGGMYRATGELPGPLGMFYVIKGFFVPRILPIAVFLLAFSLCYIVLVGGELFPLLVTAVIAVYLIYESLRTYKLPSLLLAEEDKEEGYY